MFAVLHIIFSQSPGVLPQTQSSGELEILNASENGFICGISRVTLFIQQHAGLGSNLPFHGVSLRKSLINDWIAEFSHFYLSSFQQMCCVTTLPSWIWTH